MQHVRPERSKQLADKPSLAAVLMAGDVQRPHFHPSAGERPDKWMVLSVDDRDDDDAVAARDVPGTEGAYHTFQPTNGGWGEAVYDRQGKSNVGAQDSR